MNDRSHGYAYETIEILVGKRTRRGYPLWVNQSPAGDARSFSRLNVGSKAVKELLGLLESNHANEAHLQHLGNLLFAALFVGDIATLYRASLSRVRGQGKQLRIRLTLEPPELAALPWEFLYDAQEETFLAISLETALVRYIPMQAPVHPSVIQSPLRLLVVIASPKDAQRLDTQREQALIKEALAQLTTQGQVELHFLERATVAGISQAMRDVRPHIFHFVGHSCFEQDQASILVEDEEGYTKVVNERIFREFFTGYPETRLAVLNACQSATTSINQPLVGMAPRLLQRQLSAVVAMQHPILDTSALIFTREFYRSLALGYPVEAAVSEARRGIYLEVGGQSPDWGVPVLFLRAQEGQLFALEAIEQPHKDMPDQPGVPAVHISTTGGDFVSRDKIVQGDEVRGDKIAGDKVAGGKTEVHIGHVEPGAQVIIGDVQSTQAPPFETPPPPEPTRPPEFAGFVGRQAELAHYTERLKTTGLAVICGMAGVGKSALAAMLAKQMAPPNQIFWHSFHEEEGLSAIIWQLAGFLARHGQEGLWQMLQRAQQTGSELPPPATLFSYLLQLVRGQHYLFCLDDFQFVDEDPLLVEFVKRLRALLTAGELSLIVTSRRLPNFVQTTEIAVLGGLSETDTRDLLANRGLSLPALLVSDLHTQTGGNAQLLTLAVSALHVTADPARLVAHLVEVGDVERYLMNQVDQGLSKDERSVMMAVAVLLGYPGTRQALETILGGDSIYRPLYDLSQRYLLLVSESERGREYSQHATLQAFYYAALGPRECQALHRRAGEFYGAESDVLKAARHYQRAGDYPQATRLATANVWMIINQGQARALRNLLDRFRREQLETMDWVQVNLARGQIYALLGEGQLARTSYQEALTQLAAQPASPERLELRARACRGMGALLEYESPQEALEWLKRGLDELAGVSGAEEAALHIRVGSVLFALGDFEESHRSLEQGLALLSTAPSQLRASALINLGNIYSAQGDLVQGSAYAQQALEISQQLHDEFLILAIRRNLGIDKETAGQWSEATADYQAALALAERLGSVVDQVEVANSLGTLYTKLGDDQQAFLHLMHSIELARNSDLNESLSYALTSLAELHIRTGDAQTAAALLQEAEQLALALDTKYLLAEIDCHWGQVHLLNRQPAAAQAKIERALASALDLEIELEEGKYLRVLGQVQAANNQRTQAMATLAQSYAQLANRDLYEAACTQMVWGQLLVVNGEVEQGQDLLQKARSTCRELGVQRDQLVANKSELNMNDETGSAWLHE